MRYCGYCKTTFDEQSEHECKNPRCKAPLRRLSAKGDSLRIIQCQRCFALIYALWTFCSHCGMEKETSVKKLKSLQLFQQQKLDMTLELDQWIEDEIDKHSSQNSKELEKQLQEGIPSTSAGVAVDVKEDSDLQHQLEGTASTSANLIEDNERSNDQSTADVIVEAEATSVTQNASNILNTSISEHPDEQTGSTNVPKLITKTKRRVNAARSHVHGKKKK